jgi:hypothetical protein
VLNHAGVHRMRRAPVHACLQQPPCTSGAGPDASSPSKFPAIGAQRRPAVAGDVARGVEPVAPVAAFLRDRQPHQRLHAGEEEASVFERLFVVEGDRGQCHGSSCRLIQRRGKSGGCGRRWPSRPPFRSAPPAHARAHRRGRRCATRTAHPARPSVSRRRCRRSP